jgi:hypothetical protein
LETKGKRTAPVKFGGVSVKKHGGHLGAPVGSREPVSGSMQGGGTARAPV